MHRTLLRQIKRALLLPDADALPTLLEAARVFAQRILSEGGRDEAARIDFAFRTCLQRNPTATEHARLQSFLQQQQHGYAHDRKAADTLVAAGPAPRPASVDTRELAAWTMVANVLFNLDEVLTKD